MELLKFEMKKELKRLQRQDLSMQSQFDQVFSRIAELKAVVDSFDSRLVVSDNTMAIIFKLLRIQYALCHQDELDKQDMFLMGVKDQPRSAHQESVELAKNSI